MPEKMPCYCKLRAQARLSTNLSMYVNSKSTRQTACTHTKPDMHVHLSALSCKHSVRDCRPKSSFGCSCPPTASMAVGKSRRAFVRVRMWSRGPLHCSVMTCQSFFESFDNTLGFRYERMAVVVQGLAIWGVLFLVPTPPP
jgi:hypothetical protein